MPTVTPPADVALCVGVDVGQRIDASAICVAQLAGMGIDTTFLVRHLERRPLGEAYPLVAARVVRVVENAIRHLRQPRYADGTGEHPAGWILSNGWDFGISVTVRLDATGVGRPVCELVADALAAANLESLQATVTLEYCSFTFGERSTWAGGERRVGKAFLVSRLQALLHTRRVRLPQTSEALALSTELLHFEIRVDPDGDSKFGAFKTGAHDDLVTALGLSVLEDRQPPPVTATFDYRRRVFREPKPMVAPRGGGYR